MNASVLLGCLTRTTYPVESTGIGSSETISEVSTAALGVLNSSDEVMQNFGPLLRKQLAGLIVTLD
jgi:hypothetical protein